MAEKKKYGEIESFDPDWINNVDWTDPEQAKLAAKRAAEQWAEDANDKLKNLHSGFTKANQTLSEWEKFRDNNAELLDAKNWNRLYHAVASSNGVDGLLERLQASQQTHAADRQLQQHEQDLRTAVNAGDIDWEDAKPLLAELRQKKADLDRATQWITTGRDADLKSIQEYVAQTMQGVQQQTAAVLHPILEAFDAFAAKDGRKPSDVLKNMADKKLPTFQDSWKDLYGEQEMRERLQRETDEKNKTWLAEKEAELEKKFEARFVGAAGEGAINPDATRIFKRNKERAVPTNAEERTKLTLKRLGVTA